MSGEDSLSLKGTQPAVRQSQRLKCKLNQKNMKSPVKEILTKAPEEETANIFQDNQMPENSLLNEARGQDDGSDTLVVHADTTSLPQTGALIMEVEVVPLSGSENRGHLVKISSDEAALVKPRKKNQGTNEYMEQLSGGQWKCRECGKTSSSKSNLLVHTRTHSGDKPFVCSLCSHSFSVLGNYQRHLRLAHQKGEQWVCSVCQTKVDSQDLLQSHMTDVHPTHIEESAAGNKGFQCGICEKYFKYKSLFTAHQATHSGEQPHQCEFCQKCFSFKTNLMRHRKIHTGDKRHSCDECGQKFIEKKSLVTHVKNHHPSQVSKLLGEAGVSSNRNTKPTDPSSSVSLSPSGVTESTCKTYQCLECSHVFKTKSNLHRHMRIHTGERPYKCDVCDKTFTEKRCVVVHRRLHTGEKPFRCEVCDKSFTQASTLYAHSAVHTKKRSFTCQQCGSTFLRRSHYAYHMLKHRSSPHIKCTHCDMRFYRLGELKRHALKHTNERPYRCKLCPKSFTRQQYLREHLNTHSGNQPYQCKYCHRCFAESGSYRKHLRTHNSRNTPLEHNYGLVKTAGEALGLSPVVGETMEVNSTQYVVCEDQGFVGDGKIGGGVGNDEGCVMEGDGLKGESEQNIQFDLRGLPEVIESHANVVENCDATQPQPQTQYIIVNEGSSEVAGEVSENCQFLLGLNQQVVMLENGECCVTERALPGNMPQNGENNTEGSLAGALQGNGKYVTEGAYTRTSQENGVCYTTEGALSSNETIINPSTPVSLPVNLELLSGGMGEFETEDSSIAQAFLTLQDSQPGFLNVTLKESNFPDPSLKDYG